MKMMHSIELCAPQIDAIIERYNPKDDFMTPDIYLKLKDFYTVFSCIKSRGDDKIRQIWLEVDGGPIEAYGSYEEYKEEGEVESPEEFEQFITCLRERITKETDKLRRNPVDFNSYIRQNLSWTKRFGKIIRKEHWDILGDNAVRLDRNLGEETIDKLKMLVEGTKSENTVYSEEMTAGRFFRICEICYDVNGCCHVQ